MAMGGYDARKDTVVVPSLRLHGGAHRPGRGWAESRRLCVKVAGSVVEGGSPARVAGARRSWSGKRGQGRSWREARSRSSRSKEVDLVQIIDYITECSRVGAAAELRERNLWSPSPQPASLACIPPSIVHRCWICKPQQRINDVGGQARSETVVMIFAKQWKTMLTKATFVGHGFTRKPREYEKLKLKAMHGIVQFEVYLTCADLRMKGRRQNLAEELNKIKDLWTNNHNGSIVWRSADNSHYNDK